VTKAEDPITRQRLDELRTELEERLKRNPRSSRSSRSRDSIAADLEDVERAIRTLEAGTYGLCETCGKPIAKDRLDALPAARFCREDQQSRER
jgi:RNA polymerase-binding transcription factor DksA